MSTRSNIILTDGVSIDNKKVILYYGHDSYPEWLGVVLANVCEELKKIYWFFEPEEIATMLVKHGVMVEEDGEKKLYNDFHISRLQKMASEENYTFAFFKFHLCLPAYTDARNHEGVIGNGISGDLSAL